MARDTFERILEQTPGNLTPSARLRSSHGNGQAQEPQSFFNSDGEPLDTKAIWDRSGDAEFSERLDLTTYRIDEETLKLLPHEVARTHRIIPLFLFRPRNALLCAMSAAEIDDLSKYCTATDAARFITGYEIRVIYSTPQSFAKVMEYYDRLAVNDSGIQTSGILEDDPSGQERS